MIFPMSGSTWKSKSALRKIVTALKRFAGEILIVSLSLGEGTREIIRSAGFHSSLSLSCAGCECLGLLVAQRHDGIYPSCAARGNVAGAKRHGGQQDGDARKR